MWLHWNAIKVYSANSPYTYDPISDSVLVHVDVVTCPWPDDEIMNDPMVRLQLKDWLNISDSLNLERGGLIMQDTLLMDYSLQYSPGNLATISQCRFDIQLLSQAGYKVVGLWHTHPIDGGKKFTNCAKALPNWVAAWGPSGEDFEAEADAGGVLPMYIIDHNDVYRIKNASRSNKSAWNTPATTAKMSWKTCAGWTP
jgi:hypothetical protein